MYGNKSVAFALLKRIYAGHVSKVVTFYEMLKVCFVVAFYGIFLDL
jgi:hypothetical protein